MLLTTPKRVEFNREEYEKEVNRIYSKSASEVLKLQEKLGWYYKDDSEFIYKNWNKIKKILNNTFNRNVLLNQREQPRYHHCINNIK